MKSSMPLLLRAAAGLCSLWYLAIGLGCVFFPSLALEQFHLVADGVAGMSTVRGDLGGLFLAMGALGLVGIRPSVAGRAYLISVAVVLGTIGVARIPGLLFDGFDLFIAALSLVEFAMAALFIATARATAQDAA